MTDVSMDYIKALEKECVGISSKKLEPHVKRTFSDSKEWSMDVLSSDDKKVKFYTGLSSFDMLLTVFDFVSAYVKDGNK